MTQTIQSVDVAICTWNRESLLQQTLQSVAMLSVPNDVSLTVLLVDNGSTDRTPEVIQEFVDSDVGFRVVALKESRQGHTFSRNCGVAASLADLILWTDDDVLLPSDWIEAYVAAAEAQPNVDFWGGQIEPEFVGGKPNWIDATWDIVQGCFAARDLGPESIELTEDRLPYGANFAVRGAVQRENLFSTELGRRGDLVLGEDEIDFMKRLIAAGHRGRWVPSSPVKHLIPTKRATVDYVHDYFVGQGCILAARGEAWHENVDQLRQESKRERWQFQMKRYFSSPQTWVSHLVRSALARGQADFLQGKK
ncbi:MAG: glycosyltransferase [Planctomycetota bacterium]